MCSSSKYLSSTFDTLLTSLRRYIAEGNSKFGSVTIESPEASEQSLLKFRLFIDGEEKWNSILLSPPMLKGKGRSKDALWG